MTQGCRKVSIIGEAPILSIPKFAGNIGGEELLVARNIGGHVPLCPSLPTVLRNIELWASHVSTYVLSVTLESLRRLGIRRLKTIA